jgi:hypothetical protein
MTSTLRKGWAALALACTLAAAALAATAAPASAQQPLPTAVGRNSDKTVNQAVTPCYAPAGGGQGDCTYTAPDKPLPVGQTFTDISVSPTVTAGTYAAGNAVGALQTLTLPTTTGRIEEVTLYAKSSQTAEVDLIWCGGQQPTSTTITDKTAAGLAVADFAKCRQIVQLTAWRSVGTPSAVDSGQISIPYNLGGASTTGYLFLVTQGALAPASTSDLTLTLRVAR